MDDIHTTTKVVDIRYLGRINDFVKDDYVNSNFSTENIKLNMSRNNFLKS